eukprot:m51a1_g5127 hypothetical protein (613) ;mRNA; r:394637-397128
MQQSTAGTHQQAVAASGWAALLGVADEKERAIREACVHVGRLGESARMRGETANSLLMKLPAAWPSEDPTVRDMWAALQAGKMAEREAYFALMTVVKEQHKRLLALQSDLNRSCANLRAEGEQREREIEASQAKAAQMAEDRAKAVEAREKAREKKGHAKDVVKLDEEIARIDAALEAHERAHAELVKAHREKHVPDLVCRINEAMRKRLEGMKAIFATVAEAEIKCAALMPVVAQSFSESVAKIDVAADMGEVRNGLLSRAAQAQQQQQQQQLAQLADQQQQAQQQSGVKRSKSKGKISKILTLRRNSKGKKEATAPAPAVSAAAASTAAVAHTRSPKPACAMEAIERLVDCFVSLGGAREKGIFRESLLSKTLVDEAMERLDTQMPDSAEMAAELIKRCLSSLPEPLIPYTLYDAVLRKEQPMVVFEKVPEPNKRVLAKLMGLMRFMALPENAEHSKMSLTNLVIVFAPSLLRPREETVESLGALPLLRDFLTRLANELPAAPLSTPPAVTASPMPPPAVTLTPPPEAAPAAPRSLVVSVEDDGDDDDDDESEGTGQSACESETYNSGADDEIDLLRAPASAAHPAAPGGDVPRIVLSPSLEPTCSAGSS